MGSQIYRKKRLRISGSPLRVVEEILTQVKGTDQEKSEDIPAREAERLD